MFFVYIVDNQFFVLFWGGFNQLICAKWRRKKYALNKRKYGLHKLKYGLHKPFMVLNMDVCIILI